ncbi:MAG: putative porin [Steroidobacteraceae bacterium]
MVKLLRPLTTMAIALPLAWSACGEQSQAAPTQAAAPAPAAPPPGAPTQSVQSQEERNLNELRDTVVNLLQGLVQRGVLTREQAEAMVKAAQEKAAADAATVAQQKKEQEKEEANAVRVPYVPQIVKDEISKQVAEQVTPEVAREVISQAKQEQWGVPGALPDWIKRITWGGDIRVRGEGDVYPRGNAQNAYLNFNAVNAAGGIQKAGTAAFLNTSTDRYYTLVRLRLDMNAALSSGFNVGARLSTGTLSNPDSLNQVLGQYGGRYATDIDLAYLRWTGGEAHGRQLLDVWGGKFQNPFLYSDLLWMPDVTFEGVAASYRLGLSPDLTKRNWFLTFGAFPEQTVPSSNNYAPASYNKWLYAGQTGLDFQSSRGDRLRFGIAYYDFNHLAGQKNALDSNLTDFTAAPYLQKGNTLFDIRNNSDAATNPENLFALASDYRELDFMLSADWMITSRHRLSFFGDYVKNRGYNASAVSARVGVNVPPRIKGYESELRFGSPKLDHTGAWDAFVGYRYVQRDAVLDAFTDQDYHLGGTDNKGFILGSEVSLTNGVWLRARYMPFDAIDGPPLSIDVWQVEINARF